MGGAVDSEEFRTHAHAVVDWMADYLDNVESYPVRAQVAPGEIAARLAPAAPEKGESMGDILADFERVVLPGITHWQHPSFFAYFPANSSPPSVLAEMLTAALGAQCMLWQTSPAATEMETRVLDWLRRMIGLPEGFVGVIQDTASAATLCALLTARERGSDWRTNETGLAGAGAFTAYCSAEAHSSVEKAVKIAGLGAASLRKIAVDDRFAMRPECLRDAIRADLEAGRTPLFAVATLGTTASSGFDPLRPVGELCRAHGVWLHVDAAWAGSALVSPDQRWMIEGIEHADSFVFNPHKWLFTNFDCSAYFVRDPGALVRTFEILPEYLKTAETGRVIDYRDWGIPLGRRFRALKLWFVLRAYGVEGLRARLKAHIDMAHAVAAEINAAPDFEIVAPPVLSLLCLRYRPAGIDDASALDALNRRLLNRLNDSGALFLSQTRIRDRFALRFSIGQTTTEPRHVEAAWARIQETARALET